MKKKIVAAATGVTTVALAAWLGGSFVASQRAEASLQAFKDAPRNPSGGLRLAKLTHERGLFSSKGQAEWVFEPGCAAQAGEDESITLRVDYAMSHLVMPGSLTRFDWQATPVGTTADSFKRLFGSANPLAGKGSVSTDGSLRTELALPEINYQRAGEAFQVAPSKGFLSVQGPALHFGWKADRIVARGSGQAMEAREVALDMELKNRYLGTGWARLGAEKVSLGAGSMEGVSLRSEASEEGDRLNITLTPSVRRLNASGTALSDLSMDIAFKGLDTRSVETLSRIFEDSCGMQSMTAEEARKARDAATRLLVRGLSMGIPRISGKSADGSIQGHLMVELAESRDGKPSMARQLRTNGQIEVSGGLVTAEQRDMAVNMGFAVVKGQGLMSGFSYENGLLKINDRARDASALQAGLKEADQKLSDLMAGLGQSPEKVSQAPADKPAPAPVAGPVQETALPAVAPSAAPSAAAPPATAVEAAPAITLAKVPPQSPAASNDCSALSACVAQLLAAGRNKDNDALRRLSTMVDALPKPDQGNRTVSRQLNSAGIEALQRDDAAGAVNKLRQALRENPRDVEVAANLGFALVKAGNAEQAVEVLQSALVLDPRRGSTWTPLAEAYALSGRAEDARAALWVAFQWSGNRDKSLNFYQDRAARETRPALQALYNHMAVVAQQQIALAR